MCCIFTCCGWMIDLIQRLWTFFMACCISSAVCCVLITSSMSGIALGYNYSLAEYIDLKETNVSVYLKRGVFDDEIADDMDWRRSGHMPVQGHLKDSNLVTGAPEGPEEMPLRSGRRLDDSIIVSDDKHNFEGQLMRLTAKPPDARRIGQLSPSPEPVTSDAQMQEIMEKYPLGSLEQMKSIHELVNMRRSGGAVSRNTILPPTNAPVGYDSGGRRVLGPVGPMVQPEMLPVDYDPVVREAYRRMHPARFAVPNDSVGDPANWFLAKNQVPDAYRRTMDLVDYENLPSSIITRPQPIRISTEIQRPTRPSVQRPTPTQLVKLKETISDQAFTEKDLDAFRNKLIMEKIDLPRLNKNQFKEPPSSKEFKSEEDYEDEANKGLPIRKKRAKRNVGGDNRYAFDATSTNNQNNNSSKTNSSTKTTRSVFVSKLISSSYKNVFGESSSKSAISNFSPLLTGKSSSIIITRLSLH